MLTRRPVWLAAISVLCVSLLALSGLRAATDTLPSQLTDQEFWKLSTEFSEPDGFFRSDNLLSNEVWLQRVIPDLLNTVKAPSVYMGVGPEQNFTYIAALKPKMVFLVDVRRGNLDLQLMYKAVFELSADRAEFVSKLFSKKRPEGLDRNSTASEIFAAFKNVESSETLYKDNLKAIDDLLLTKHHFALSDGDVQGVEYVYHAFFNFGPALNYSSTGGFGGRYQPSYADLMAGTDEAGLSRSFLANEDNFNVLKSLETKNLMVPVVGNFAGPKAIRAVGDYREVEGRDRVGVLPVERRAVPLPGSHLDQLLPQRRHAAARRDEHVHPFRARRRLRSGHGAQLGVGRHAGRGEGLRREWAVARQASGLAGFSFSTVASSSCCSWPCRRPCTSRSIPNGST